MDLQKYQEGNLSQISTDTQSGMDLRNEKQQRSGFAENVDSISSLIQSNTDAINKIVDLGSNMVAVYAESQRLNAQIEVVEKQSKVELAKITAKFLATRDLIEHVFSERKDVLSKYYMVLDKAIETGDSDLIVKSMQQIGAVVTTSPLADINNFICRFNDTSQPLLDF